MAHIERTMPYARPLFADRAEAGERLNEFVGSADAPQAIVLGVARGGVPVGFPLARRLGAPLDVIVPRKLPLPDSPEAGFGAIAPDGSLVLNEELTAYAGLSEATIRSIAQRVLREVHRREQEYRGGRSAPELATQTVFLTDDGLASGYTMLAAIRMARRAAAARVIVAVPVSPADSLERVAEEADEVHCLVVQERGPFAVASFYKRFPDMSDDEVKEWLSRATA